MIVVDIWDENEDRTTFKTDIDKRYLSRLAAEILVVINQYEMSEVEMDFVRYDQEIRGFTLIKGGKINDGGGD